jgi:hypothetical protein
MELRDAELDKRGQSRPRKGLRDAMRALAERAGWAKGRAGRSVGANQPRTAVPVLVRQEEERGR